MKVYIVTNYTEQRYSLPDSVWVDLVKAMTYVKTVLETAYPDQEIVFGTDPHSGAVSLTIPKTRADWEIREYGVSE
jgi:hypothetical protein